MADNESYKPTDRRDAKKPEKPKPKPPPPDDDPSLVQPKAWGLPGIHDGMTIMDMGPLTPDPKTNPPTDMTLKAPNAPPTAPPKLAEMSADFTDLTLKADVTPPSRQTSDSNPPSKGGSSSSNSRRPSQDPTPDEVKPFLSDLSRRMNQYILAKQVGAGGMGAVWKAWDIKLRRWVAIKQLNVSDEESIRRFEREAQLAAHLRHPNICGIYEVNEAQGRHYLVLDFIDGGSLSKTQLPLRPILEIFVKVCRAIQFAHANDIIHRDLKPANIMMSSAGEPFVTDFGLAKLMQAESSISIQGAIMGTPAYMPPEQAAGKLEELDARSDIYSLGATLYALCAGKAPFEADNATTLLFKVCTEEPTPPRKHKPDIPAPIEAVILKAMEKEKRSRYLTAGEMADDLERFLNDQPVSARPPSTVERLFRKLRKNKLPAAATSAIVIAAAIVTVVVVNARRQRNNQNQNVDPIVKTITIPPPEQSEEQKRIAAWKDIWEQVQPKLLWVAFKSSSPDLVEATRKHVAGVPEGDAGEGLRKDAMAWLTDQLESIPKPEWPKSEWADKRSAAQRADEFAVMLASIVEKEGGGADALRAVSKRVRDQYAPLLAWRGTFSLKLYAMPYAELRHLKVGDAAVFKDGKPVDGVRLVGDSGFTPLVLQNLEIADLTITLHHPTLGTREFKVASADLQNGRTYLWSGSMEKPETFRLRISP